MSLEKNETQLLAIVSNAVQEMSEGELLQIEKARRLDISEPVYFEIISKKTASLIASCCACGAAAAGAGKEGVDRMLEFGRRVGVAFQIKDDLFDFNAGSNNTGKPSGIDIKEQKMTLPLIYMLNNAGPADKRRAIRTVKYYNTNPERVAQVIRDVNNSGGMEYAREKMIEYRDAAIQLLHSFPASEARQSLEELVVYTTERKK